MRHHKNGLSRLLLICWLVGIFSLILCVFLKHFHNLSHSLCPITIFIFCRCLWYKVLESLSWRTKNSAEHLLCFTCIVQHLCAAGLLIFISSLFILMFNAIKYEDKPWPMHLVLGRRRRCCLTVCGFNVSAMKFLQCTKYLFRVFRGFSSTEY